MNRPTLAEIVNEFGPKIDAPFAIAGGACRDTLAGIEPRDCDLFCFAPPDRYALAESYPVLPMMGQGYANSWCKSYRWRGETIQVIHQPWSRSALATVDTFDWAVCMHFTFDGVTIHSHPQSQRITPGGYLRLNNPAIRPGRSLERGFRFAERFGMMLRPDDVEQLRDRMAAAERFARFANRRFGPRLRVAA